MDKKTAKTFFDRFCQTEGIENPSSLKYIQDLTEEELENFSLIDSTKLNNNGELVRLTPDSSELYIKDAPVNWDWYLEWNKKGYQFTSCEILGSSEPCVILEHQDPHFYLSISKEIWNLIKEDLNN